MNWFKRLLQRPVPMEVAQIQDGFPVPWSVGRPSIHGYLSSFGVEAGQRLPDEAMRLPDEELLLSRQGSQLRWAPGAMDGVLGHHTARSDDPDVARVLDLLLSAANTRSANATKDFYDLIVCDEVLGKIDSLLDAVSTSPAADPERLRALARWLATESPDRGAVKMGIALLGILQPPLDTAVLTTLGMHEEFTLFAGVALSNTLEEPAREEALWSLAKRVEGWGRIHLVERLSNTQNAQIKDWLLREGYRNSVMFQYLAYPCAVGGELLHALQANDIDEALLHGAGDILQALLEGGPAQDMGDYADGADATALYLEHLARRMPARLADYLIASDVAHFVANDDQDWARYEVGGWTAQGRARIAALAQAIVADDRWLALVQEGLRSKDDADFWTAATAAERLGLDPWEVRFERQHKGEGDQWFFLMRSDDRARIERVVTLAMAQLDLDQIATGPAEEMGLGAVYAQHSALDMILQDLGRFPSLGWSLVAAGLRSPVVRNRNMALRALSGWGRDQWPTEAESALKVAQDIEPTERVRANMVRVLAGQALE